MAEERNVNVDTEEHFFDSDHDVTEMTQRIEKLESEKQRLLRENQEMNERIVSLTAEVEGLEGGKEKMDEKLGEMEREIERSDEDKNILETISARAVQLETDVARLQHDLINSENDAADANALVGELKGALAKQGEELEGLKNELEVLKKVQTENEKIIRDLEIEVSTLEVKENQERSNKLRFEEVMKEKLKEKEIEIGQFKSKIDRLELEKDTIATNIGVCKSEKALLDAALHDAKGIETDLQFKMVQLQKQIGETNKELLERNLEPINGDVDDDDDNNGVDWHWPIVAAGSAGAIGIAAAILYVYHLRQRNQG